MTFQRLTTPTLAAAIMASSFATFAAAQERTLATVVVTASGHEQNIADAPASISVITREELEKQAYTNITDAVKNIPGVFVTGGGSAQDISMRGQSQSYTLYLVDGRPVSAGRSVNTNGADSGKQIGLPPLAMVERIEVIRGPMSSLYGSDAMGGVINIITRKTAKTWHGSVSVDYTLSDNDVSEDGYMVSGFASGPVIPDLLGLKVNGAYLHTDESHFVGGADNAESRPKTQRKQGGFEFTLTPNKDNRIGLAYQSARQDTTHTPGKSVDATATLSEYRFDKDIYTLSHEGRYGDLMVNSYYQRDVSDKVQELVKKETVDVLNTQATYAMGEHLLTFGGQYKTEEVINETNGLINAVPGVGVRSADRWLAAVFAEMDWGVSDKLSVTTGLRYNRDEFFGGHFSPRVYGVYRASDSVTFKGGVSTGYKQPSLAQSSAGIGSTTGGGGWQNFAPNNRGLILGNPDLKPETSTNIELGAAFESADRKLKSSVMVFHTDFKDKIAEDRFCTSPNAANNNDYANWGCSYGANKYYFLSTNMNVDKAVMQGVEATLDYQLSSALKISSSYTYTDSEQKSGQYQGQALTKQPKHMLNALVDWQLNHQVNLWAQGNYRSETSDFLNRTSMNEGTPGYSLFDVGVVYQLNDKTRLKAGIYNVANKKITNDTYGVVLDGRRATVGMTMDF